jgi:hypothetical protein
MKRIVILGLVGLVLAAGGALLRWTVFLDIEQFRDDLGVKAATGAPAHFLGEQARRFHRGDGPCLRYIESDAVSQEDLDRTADEAEAAGVAADVMPLFALFLRWAQEADAPHHASDEAEEWLTSVRERVHGLDRLVLALNFGRVLRSLRAEHEAAALRVIGEAERKVTPPLREKLHALWLKHPVLLSVPGSIRLRPELKRRVTAARMEHIAQAALKWRSAHGAWPDRLSDLRLAGDDLKDGWSRDIQYERKGDGARLVSEEGEHPRIERELR